MGERFNLHKLFGLPKKTGCGVCSTISDNGWNQYQFYGSSLQESVNKEIELDHYCNECDSVTTLKIILKTDFELC